MSETKTAPKEEKPFHWIEHHKKRLFLTAFVECGGNCTKAAEIAGVSLGTPYSRPWAEDEEFQDAWRKAKAMAVEFLEAEAIRRAYDGVDEPVGWFKGEAGGVIRRYSDTLLIFLLKGAKPEKYRDTMKVTPEDAETIARQIREALAKIAETDG